MDPSVEQSIPEPQEEQTDGPSWIESVFSTKKGAPRDQQSQGDQATRRDDQAAEDNPPEDDTEKTNRRSKKNDDDGLVEIEVGEGKERRTIRVNAEAAQDVERVERERQALLRKMHEDRRKPTEEQPRREAEDPEKFTAPKDDENFSKWGNAYLSAIYKAVDEEDASSFMELNRRLINAHVKPLEARLDAYESEIKELKDTNLALISLNRDRLQEHAVSDVAKELAKKRNVAMPDTKKLTEHAVKLAEADGEALGAHHVREAFALLTRPNKENLSDYTESRRPNAPNGTGRPGARTTAPNERPRSSSSGGAMPFTGIS